LKNKGFSLLEILIGVVILAVGILAIATLQTTSVRGNFFSHNLMQATYVAQDRLENLKNLPFTDDLLKAKDHYDDGTVTLLGVIFNRSYVVIDDAGGYKTINYIVTWNDGSNHRISFSTIRAQ